VAKLGRACGSLRVFGRLGGGGDVLFAQWFRFFRSSTCVFRQSCGVFRALRVALAERVLIFAGHFSIEKACLVHAVSLGVELNGY